jgi:uncharacterized protein YjbI with pentapeptide repeats
MLTTISTQEEQQRLQDQRFYDTLATVTDLRGLIPGRRSLAHLYLPSKDLSGAHLQEAQLVGSQLQDTLLVGADLEGADARSTNFRNVDFFQANLSKADFREADLRSAKFEDAFISRETKFTGARVNSQTCWPKSFFEHVAPTAGLVPSNGPGDGGNPLGHICAVGEHEKSGPSKR